MQKKSEKKIIKPLGNRVLIKREKISISKGGILLPETSKEKPLQGEVVAVGNGSMDDEGRIHPLSVKIGDKILFSSYAGVEVTPTDNEEFLILSEDDLLVVLE